MSLRRQVDGRQGILPFVIEMGEREDVTARAGLPLVIETFRAMCLEEVAEEKLPQPKRQRDFTQADKLESLATLIAAGGDRIEDIQILNDDKGLMRLVGKPFPSPDILLDFLKTFHDPLAWSDRPLDEKSFVPVESAALRGLDAINMTLVQRGADPTITTATIDHDGTIIESHKRDAKIAYEGTRGYQPLVAVWAEQQLIVGDEFRDGNVPGGKDPLSSVKRAFENLPPWVEKRYFRGDSADYYAPLLQYLISQEIGFTISADMTQQLRDCCLKVTDWVELEKRTRDQVDWAEVEFSSGDWPKGAPALRYIVLRITLLQLELFEQRSPKYLAVVSNRNDFSAPELVKWHWGKAGTIEHVHRIVKDELSGAVMPSQNFGANAAWFRINTLTFNLLTVLKRKALPERYGLARPKCLRFEIFTIPARLSVHQSQLVARFSASEKRVEEIVTARRCLLQMREAMKSPQALSPKIS